MEMANFPALYYTHTIQQLPSFKSLKPFIYFCKSTHQFHQIHQINHTRCYLKPSIMFKRKPFRIMNCATSPLNDCSNGSNSSSSSSVTDIWADSGFVEVIGIGSRVDSVLDFCLQSSSSSSNSLRFWNVIKSESLRGQLRQRFHGEDSSPNIVEAPLKSQSHLKTVVLVASAGYGDDYIVAAEILRAIRSGNGLVIAVVLKPFSFEGQRRQDEVKMLVDKLQDCVNFRIDIDIDTLLKMDMVTLDEALKTAYRAVSTAITTLFVLVSDRHKKYNHSLLDSMTQVTAAEVKKVLDSYKEGRVGFGVAQNVEASIVQAVYDCPFLSMGLKDLDGVVLCVLTSSSAIGDNDVCNLLRAFREATKCTKEVIISVVQNPVMKPNLIASSVIIVGNVEGKSLQKSSILSRLADSIPFVFNFLRGHDVEAEKPKENNLTENILPPMLPSFADKNEVPEMMVPAEDTTDNFEIYSGKMMVMSENFDEKEYAVGEIEEVEHLNASANAFEYIEGNFQGTQASGEKSFISRNIGPGYKVVQERHEEELNVTEAVTGADNPKNFQLPVGVKLSDQIHGNLDRADSRQPMEKNIIDEATTVSASAVPSLEMVSDIWSTSTLLKRKNLDVPKRQGHLSARAASMLEAERDSKIKWSPVMKIQYRGGMYKGRCQGGLPEGRGRLTFQDGSVYDGMWRLGKRSGLGSLFFSNGDVFHGSWRDDLMHGKGWLYFHTGERWFVNFWKGRPNGEGRFYSKSGEVLFGQFRDGWRDGRFLCVKVDGKRYVEVWNEGVLLTCEELDS
ncbi:protein ACCUMULATION AND REPLICATION OF CHLOROPLASTS 3, chloroplastic [Silene latifolia]|uniref:protein ACCUMULATION AND REPLICATION OF CHLOROPLASTS 3, chloroplastic n=1 Tax=Silene latifolia TaxID=37657 RepID=UPI003D776613